MSMPSLATKITVNLASDWHYPLCQITYNRDSWVKLIQLPSDYSADEAKLLCQESAEIWVAWVPDHGEVVLNRSDFYC